MPWIELHIKTTATCADSLGDQLALLGAEAVTFQDAGDQPIYEPAPGSYELWQETIAIGLFDHTCDLNPILAYLEQQQATGLIKNFQLRHVADQDWERVCLAYFKPTQFGKKLWICPSWHTPPDPNAVNVILDPGLAFGTGTHPTTALCLEWLEQHISNQAFVIDYGCGSGILGLAALKLGAKQAIAVDNDPQALEATEKNAARNQDISERLTTCLPNQLGTLPQSADVLIANILARPLIDLAPSFAAMTHSGSLILLSGILPQQIEEVKKAYAPWFTLQESLNETREWARLAGYRQ